MVTGSQIECPAVVVMADGDLLERIVTALSDQGLKLALTSAGPSGAIELDEATDGLGGAPDVLVLGGAAVQPKPGPVVRRVRDRLTERRLDATRIVLVLDASKPATVRETAAAGADGVVLEEDVEISLVPTLNAALAGQVAVPRGVHNHVTRPVLSFRERQALSMAVTGLTNNEIAGHLYLAESTVKSHLSSAFAKLGVRSRHEAAALVLDPEEGLAAAVLTSSVKGRPPPRG